MIRTILFLAVALTLAACATTPPPYAAAASQTSAGYAETQIEANRYFVTYRAPSGADAALIEDYALLRAADLTLQNGREWFWVDRRTVEAYVGSRSGPSVGIGGGSWGGGGGVGVGISLPIGGQRGEQASAATLEVRFGDGAKPDEPNAYDARAVSANLRSRAVPAG